MDMTYKARILRTYEQRGAAEAIQRGVSILMSHSLGRGFNEPIEAHDARHPEFVEFRTWFKTWRETVSA